MKKSVLYLSLLLISISSVIAQVCVPFGLYRITSQSVQQENADVYDNKIVWSNDGNILMCDLSLNGQAGGCLEGDGKTIISSHALFEDNPAIYYPGSYYIIVWERYTEGPNIFYCDSRDNGQANGCLETDTKTEVTIDSAAQFNDNCNVNLFDACSSIKPDVYGNWIVWEHYFLNQYSEIYACDITRNGQANGCLANDNKKRIGYDTSPHHQQPRIDGNNIIWIDYHDVHRCDLSVTLPPDTQNDPNNGYCGFNAVWQRDFSLAVTLNVAFQANATLHGNTIVWEDYINGAQPDIYTCSLPSGCDWGDAKTRITSDAGKESKPEIYNNYIIWEDERNGNIDLYMCDSNLNGQAGGCLSGDIKTRLTSNNANQLNAMVYDKMIVWHDNRAGNNDVYMYSLATACPSCQLRDVTLTANCAGGLTANCDETDTINIQGVMANDCSRANNLQIDASGTGCDVRYYDLPAGSVEFTQQINRAMTIGSSDFNFNVAWTVPSIPASCQGVTVSPVAAGLHSYSEVSSETLLDNTNDIGDTISGSFTFGLSLSGSSTTTSTSTSTTITSTTTSGTTTSVVVTGSSVCGNNVVEYGEQCDSSSIGADPSCMNLQSGVPGVEYDSCDQTGTITGTNVRCQCYSLSQLSGVETIYFTTNCQDDGDGDSKGKKTETKIEKDIATGNVISEESYQVECSFPPISVPGFGIASAAITTGLLAAYYMFKKRY